MNIKENNIIQRKKGKIVKKQNAHNVGILKYAIRGEMEMKPTTVINNISKLADNLNYKKLYIEINTRNETYVLEKKNKTKAGFDTNIREIK